MASLKDVLIRGGLCIATAGAGVLAAGGMERPVLASGAKFPVRTDYTCRFTSYESTDCSGRVIQDHEDITMPGDRSYGCVWAGWVRVAGEEEFHPQSSQATCVHVVPARNR